MALWSNSNGIFRRWVLVQRRRLLLSKTAGATQEGSVTEGIVLGDTVAADATAEGAISEGVDLGETVAGDATAEGSVSEGVDFGDTLDGETSGSQEGSVSDGVKIGDTVAGDIRRDFTVYDYSGNHRDGTARRFDPVDDWTTDTPTAYSGGHSLTFYSGDTNVIETADNAAFDATALQSLSVFVDVKLPSTNTGSNGILRKRNGNSAANAGWGLFLNDGFGSGRPYVGVSDGTNNFNLQFPTPALNDDAWHTLGFVIDRGANLLRLIKDGSQVASTSISTLGDISNSRSLEIGLGSGAQYLDGKLDNVRIYSRITDSTDWGNIHDNTSPPTDSLELWYPLDDNPTHKVGFVEDGVEFGDTVVGGVEVGGSVSDGVEIGDTTDADVSKEGSVSEGIDLGDTIAGESETDGTVQDGVTLGDSISAETVREGSVTEGVVLGDSLPSIDVAFRRIGYYSPWIGFNRTRIV